VSTQGGSSYWSAAKYGTVMTAPIGRSPLQLAVNEPNPSALVTASDEIYWVTSLASAAGGAIRGISTGQSAPTTLRTSPSHVTALVIDASSIYWAYDVAGTINRVLR